ncbi:MAG: U32 family peptidase C-terminal domain-containing protein, partial [Candidatus Delongbacteria bacterium]|nr:U32 family peptidase C-terminal domain-containing protein [Candidatus Delongbacteria bacterium]
SAVKYCNENNVRLYVTLNIIAHNEDLVGIEEYLKFLYEIKVDAIIVSDLGILNIVKRTVPGLEVHISTQFSAMNYETIKFLESLNVQRIILPRELSLEEIREIRSKTDIELEMFVHGAMCMAYSGRCMLSYHTKDRDANRGECNQTCRFQYDIAAEQIPEGFYIEEEAKRGTYFFNSKDLCLIEYISEIIKAGINSVKIEGRMKTLSYLSSVIKTYREALDSYSKDPVNYKTDPNWMEELKKVANRGYTTFKFLDKNVEASQSYDTGKASITHDIVGIVKEIINKEKMVVEVKGAFYPEQEIYIIIPNKRILTISFREIKDAIGREVTKTNPNQIVVLKYFKSVVPGSILRAKKIND